MNVVSKILGIGYNLDPIYFTFGEILKDKKDRIDNEKRFNNFIKKHKSGFYLIGKDVSYNILNDEAGNCRKLEGFFQSGHEHIEFFVKYIAALNPTFGFACSSEEREARNRHKTKIGINEVESWVGRDINKKIPGFYWITLISNELLNKHAIPLSSLTSVAKEYSNLGNNVHFFKFYEQPDEWKKTSIIDSLCSSLPGVFDIRNVDPAIAGAKNLMDLLSLLGEFN